MNGRETITRLTNKTGISVIQNQRSKFGTLNYRKRTKHKPVIYSNHIIREFARETTIHGVKYIFNQKSSLLDRFLWLTVFLASLCCTVVICGSTVQRFVESPTATVVKDTHYPLHLFPFPGVSICPKDKIKRNTAIKYIYEKLNLTGGQLNSNSLDEFLSAMYFFQHPIYSRMKDHLDKSKDILPQLAVINLTDFMLAVLPTCKELFSECNWHGTTENCCELFHKQRSEEGFCYAFNTFTSEEIRSCEDVTNHGVVQTQENCILRHNSASGTTTGLEVFLHRFDSRQNLVNHSTIVGESGALVQMHVSDEYPEAGMGTLVPAAPGVKLTTTIKAYLTRSLPTVRLLSPAQRNCYFPDEIELTVAAHYSQRSCYIECRLQFFQDTCGCRPYYFNMLDNRVPVCNTLQLHCIAEHGSDTKFFQPPREATGRGFTAAEKHHSLNCSHCLPTCMDNYYDDDEDMSTDTQTRAMNNFGYLDLHYRYGGAVYYERYVTFGWLDLIVAIGGTAGLFLGISLLSVVEILYWTIKLACFGFWGKHSISNPFHCSQPIKLPKHFIQQRDFY